MKWRQPISFCLDPVIWMDFQQPEHLTLLRALTSMQLPPRTVIYNERSQAKPPHSMTHIHTQTVRSDALRVTNDKHQLGEKKKFAHTFSFSHLVTSDPPTPSTFSPPLLPPLSDAAWGLSCQLSKRSPRVNITANTIAQVECVTLGADFTFHEQLLGHLYWDF